MDEGATGTLTGTLVEPTRMRLSPRATPRRRALFREKRGALLEPELETARALLEPEREMPSALPEVDQVRDSDCWTVSTPSRPPTKNTTARNRNTPITRMKKHPANTSHRDVVSMQEWQTLLAPVP